MLWVASKERLLEVEHELCRPSKRRVFANNSTGTPEKRRLWALGAFVWQANQMLGSTQERPNKTQLLEAAKLTDRKNPGKLWDQTFGGSLSESVASKLLAQPARLRALLHLTIRGDRGTASVRKRIMSFVCGRETAQEHDFPRFFSPEFGSDPMPRRYQEVPGFLAEAADHARAGESVDVIAVSSHHWFLPNAARLEEGSVLARLETCLKHGVRVGCVFPSADLDPTAPNIARLRTVLQKHQAIASSKNLRVALIDAGAANEGRHGYDFLSRCQAVLLRKTSPRAIESSQAIFYRILQLQHTHADDGVTTATATEQAELQAWLDSFAKWQPVQSVL